MPEEPRKPTQKIIAITGLVVIVLIAVVISMTMKKDTSETETPNTTTDTSETDTTPQTDASTEQAQTDDTEITADTYKDGTYTATGTYTSPGGRESIIATVTIKDDIVTTTSAKSGTGNSRESEEYQSDFISGYKSSVTGKDIDSIKLSRISGSSLTPKGFNDALEQIKVDARI